MPNSNAFWTDDVQAQERLTNTLVVYDDSVVYVENVQDKFVNIRPVENFRTINKVLLEDPKWHQFRKLPPLGWLNVDVSRQYDRYVGAVYVRRVALRSRLHGFCNNNTQVYVFDGIGLTAATDINARMVYACGFYKDPNQYPPFEDAFLALKDGGAIAISPKFAICKDTRGLCWLYRKDQQVMLIPDTKTGYLLKSSRFYLEDIEASKDILPLEIKEF